MATVKSELRQREDEIYAAGWDAAKRKYNKGKATKMLVAVTTVLFVVAFVACFGAWVFKNSYPEQLMDYIFKAFTLMGGGFVVKSGAENYGRITHAEEYNRNYPDA